MARSHVTGLPRMIALDLVLTEEEARMLMAMVQNPLGGVNPSREDEVQKAVRTAIFEPLYKHFHGYKQITPEGPVIQSLNSFVQEGDGPELRDRRKHIDSPTLEHQTGNYLGEAFSDNPTLSSREDTFAERAARELEGWGWRDKVGSLGSGIIEG